MATNAKPVYKRILLKLSGEALQGTEGFGIDASILDRMAQEIKELVELGIQVGVVIGGGNLFRGAGLAKAGMNRVVGDHMGMLATVMNGLAMRDALHRAHVKVMDLAAFTLARDHKLPIRVFNMNKPGALRRVVMGEKEGTLITE